MLDKFRLLRSAEKQVIRRKFNQAIRNYEKLLERDPEEPTLLNTIGDLLLKKGQRDQALDYFYRVADIYMRSGFTVKAIAMYKKIQHLNSHDLKTNEVLADLYERQSLPMEAVYHLNLLVTRYERQNDLEKAVLYLERVVELDSADPNKQVRLAELRQRKGDSGGAVQKYLEAISLLKKQNYHEKAFQLAGEALGLSEQDRNVLRTYVECAESAGRLDSAAAFLRKRLVSDQQKYPWQMYLAWLQEKRGDREVAHQLYQELHSDGISDPLVLQGLQRTAQGSLESPENYAVFPQGLNESAEAVEFSSASDTNGGDASAGATSDSELRLFHFDDSTSAELLAGQGREPQEEVLEEELLIYPQSAEDTPAGDETPAPPEELSPISLEEGLQEADFYLKLGYHDEAQKLLQRLLQEHPRDERVLRRARKALLDLPVPEPEQLAEEIDIDFDNELNSALDFLFTGTLEDSEVALADEILRYDVASSNDGTQSASKIHYDLGLAYKELGLHEDAVQEFLTALDTFADPEENPQKILCCSMLANSFLQLEKHDEAARWAREGLNLPDKKDFEWKALQYDLARARENIGELAEALQSYQEILERDPHYRDIQGRVDQLSAQLNG
ncbi:MAG: tetratricopeptide repeat protein [Acidobacteriota bacterium]